MLTVVLLMSLSNNLPSSLVLVKPYVLLFSCILLSLLLHNFAILFLCLLGCQYYEIWRCCMATCVATDLRNSGTGIFQYLDISSKYICVIYMLEKAACAITC